MTASVASSAGRAGLSPSPDGEEGGGGPAAAAFHRGDLRCRAGRPQRRAAGDGDRAAVTCTTVGPQCHDLAIPLTFSRKINPGNRQIFQKIRPRNPTTSPPVRRVKSIRTKKYDPPILLCDIGPRTEFEQLLRNFGLTAQRRAHQSRPLVSLGLRVDNFLSKVLPRLLFCGFHELLGVRQKNLDAIGHCLFAQPANVVLTGAVRHENLGRDGPK